MFRGSTSLQRCGSPDVDGRDKHGHDGRGVIPGGHRPGRGSTHTLGAMLDLLVEGKLPKQGFVRQEEIDLDTFLANRFGRVYAGERLDEGHEPAVKNIRLDTAA